MKTYQTPIRHLLCAISALAIASPAALFAADTPARTDSSRTTDSTRSTTSATAADSSMSQRTQLSRGDRRSVEKLAKLGMEEVALSKLASERATNPQVRSFAQELVAAHEKVNNELSRLATTKNVVLPTDERPNLDKWSRKDADDFDEDYLEKMIDAHEDSVDLLESKLQKADDTEIASFARTNLPAMQDHLRKAKSLKESVAE